MLAVHQRHLPYKWRMLRAYEYEETDADELRRGEEDVLVVPREELLQVETPLLLVRRTANTGTTHITEEE